MSVSSVRRIAVLLGCVAVLVGALMLLSGLVGGWGSPSGPVAIAKSPAAGERSENAKSATAAVEALGDRLPAVARSYGWTPERLTETLLADSTLHVDSSGRLFYADPAPALAEAPEASFTAASSAPTPYPLSETFKLHSLPGAKLTIFIDFDGMTMSGNGWTATYNAGMNIVCPPFSIDADPAFSDAELAIIQGVWRRVSEDYAPFGVDVTTEFTTEAAITRSSAADAVYGTRALVSPISSYIGNYGGIAYLSAFSQVGDYCKPALVFPEKRGNDADGIAEAVSHEVGHNLSLSHDGSPAGGYYGGTGSGETGWGPIMGNSLKNVTQWSKGEYPEANNKEDDLAKIQSFLGYRADDVGDTVASASVLTTSTLVSASGLIGKNTDVDVWSFAIDDAGSWTNIEVLPAAVGPDLDILAEIRDAAGSIVASSNPVTLLRAPFSIRLQPGVYYLLIRGTGKGSPLDVGGYSNYGSLGRYSVSGSLESSRGIVLFPDANLEAAVRDCLGKQSGSIDDVDMASMTSLSGRSRYISDLSGLELATNLTTLDLDHNQIDDLAPLAGLSKLTFLDLGYNHIADIGGLAGLSRMDDLNLECNRVVDLTPLRGMAQITKLVMPYNSISDLGPLSGLTSLTYLSLGQNKVIDLGPLAGLTRISNLYLSNNKVVDVSALAGLRGMTKLILDSNLITDVGPLAGMTTLDTLGLHNNQITDVASLVNMPKLTYLSVSGNRLDLTSGSPAMSVLAPIQARAREFYYLPQSAPSTTIHGAPTGWSASDVSISFTATDNAGGTRSPVSTSIQIDGGPVTSMGAALQPVVISSDGVHEVRYNSTAAGTTETVKTATIRIDKTAPRLSSDAKSSYTGAGALTAAASDSVSGLRSVTYILDQQAARTGTSIDGVGVGPHRVVFTAIDNAGNTSTLSSDFIVVPWPPGTLSGTLTSGGTPLAGVLISLGGTTSVTTGADGRYSMPGIAVGDYMVTYSKPHYFTQAATVTIVSGRTTDKIVALTYGAPVATKLDLSTGSSSRLAYGGEFRITGTLNGDVALAGATVTLESGASGAVLGVTSYETTTDAAGAFLFTLRPTALTYYRVRFAGSADFLPTSSAVPLFALPASWVGSPVAPSTMSHSRYYTIYGYLKPRHTSGSYPVRIYKYRYVSGHWKSYGYESARASNYYSYTKYSHPIKLPYKGRWKVRAYAPADSGHFATWSSRYDYITVK